MDVVRGGLVPRVVIICIEANTYFGSIIDDSIFHSYLRLLHGCFPVPPGDYRLLLLHTIPNYSECCAPVAIAVAEEIRLTARFSFFCKSSRER